MQDASDDSDEGLSLRERCTLSMRDTPVDIGNSRIVIHNDNETPREFVVELMRTVLGRQDAEARALTAAIDRRGKAACGTFPSAVRRA